MRNLKKHSKLFSRTFTSTKHFFRLFVSLLSRLITPGRIVSLAQVLLKLTAPGVPDLYQGMELWDLSLVDPDNRRPVDYDLRKRLLSELPSLDIETIWQRQDEGLPKLWLIHQALKTRRNHFESFGRDGSYAPLLAEGLRAGHVVAFQRGGRVLTVVPRLILSIGGRLGRHDHHAAGRRLEKPIHR